MPSLGRSYGVQPGQSDFGYRSKIGVRSAAGASSLHRNENVSISSLGNQRSPRIACAAAGAGRSLIPAPRTRTAGSTFGSDITNLQGRILPKPTKHHVGVSRGSLEPAVAAMEVAIDEITPAVQQPPQMPQTIQVHAQSSQVVDVQDADEYVTDISNKLFQDEVLFMPQAHYMDKHPDLSAKMRTILIDWLVEVHMKYKMRSETLHLAINLIDRYLSRVQVTRKRLQLVGVVGMFIASKFEEITPPELPDWVYITDKAYTKDEVLSMEISMLNALSFHIVVPTAAHFFPLMQKANGCNPFQSKLAQYIIELGLLDIRLLQYTPSHVVSAALLLSNDLMGRSPRWPQNMVQQCQWTETTLGACVELLRQLYEADQAGGNLQAVNKKFQMKEHESVATARLLKP